MPRSREELTSFPSIQRQALIIRRYVEALGIPNDSWVIDVTTYRSTSFIDRAPVRSALRKALAEKRQILIASTSDLLKTIKPDKVAEILPRLSATEAEVIDCSTSTAWKDFGGDEMRQVLLNARAHVRHSAAIKQGLQSGGESASALKPSNGRLGAERNAIRAKRDAERLFPIIKELYLAVEPGATLSPSRLMHHLNDLGIPPLRATKWSLNACKNLIQRYAASSVN